jgi:RNA polymerase sigma factor (sigma-70 family)
MCDSELVAAAAAGDERAAAELHRRYRTLVRSAVGRWHEGAQADDLAQEVWLRAFRSLASFRGDCALGSWLFRIARNVSVSQLRRRALPEAGPTDRPIVERPKDVPLTVDLDRALAGLPPGMRRVVWLHDVEGWTHEEIGARLGVAAGTSRSQLFKARAKLRERLRDPGAARTAA